MFWDQVAWIYDLFADGLNRKANRALCDAVAQEISSSDEVLECACGTGLLSAPIAARCRSLVATDFSAPMLRQAQKKCCRFKNISFEQADILHLRFPDNRFEGFIAYKLPGEKLGLQTFLPLLRGVFQSLSFRELLSFAACMKTGGPSLRDRFDREKKPYIFVGMVCVREEYQHQGYMRKLLEPVFSEADRLGAYRWFWTRMPGPNAKNTCTSAWSLPECATSARTEHSMI